MSVSDFVALCNILKSEHPEIMFGRLDFNEERIFTYGILDQISYSDALYIDYKLLSTSQALNFRCEADEILISNEATFDIVDDQSNSIRLTSLYITVLEKHREKTYFIIPASPNYDYLSCVVQFWEQAREVGRDIDFALSGCRSMFPKST